MCVTYEVIRDDLVRVAPLYYTGLIPLTGDRLNKFMIPTAFDSKLKGY